MNIKFWLLIFIVGVQNIAHAQIPTGIGGGIPYPNQVTDIGIACHQYEGFAKLICKPTATEWAPFRPKCDLYRLYCKGLMAPSASTPDPSGLVPPPPPDVCPQVVYCANQKGQFNRVCPRPADQDSVKFCQTYQVYCANVPADTDGVCAAKVQQQQQADQQQYQSFVAQQQALTAQTAFSQPFYGNPFPYSASQSLPGTYSYSGVLGRKKRSFGKL